MTKNKRKSKVQDNTRLPKKRWIGLGIFVLALLIRVIYVGDSSDNPTFYTPIVDSQTYDGLARDLAAGHPMTNDFFWQPVFYPWFLTVLYWLSQGSILFVKIVQAILGAVTAWLTYRIGEKAFGRSVGILAGVLVAVYMPLVFFEVELLAAGWAAFWMAAMVLTLLKIREKPILRYCFILGLVGTLGIITRPVFTLFLGAACIWLVIVWIRGHDSLQKIMARAGGLALGFLVVASPVWMASYHVMGKARLFPYSGGINLYIGNNPDYRKTITIRPGLGWRELTSAPARQGIATDQGMERFFLDKTRNYILSEPGNFVEGMISKTAQFFTSREIPRNTDIYIFRKWSRMLGLLVWKIGKFGFPFGVLLPLAFVGLAFYRRTLTGPLWLPLVFYPVSVIVVFVASRYRVPLIPEMNVLAAAGLWALWDTAQKKQWKKLALAGVLVLGVGVACSAMGPFYEEQLDYEAELYYGLGSSFDAYGQVEEATAAYSKAIDLKADYAEAHYNLANIWKSQGKFAEAIDHYQKAVRTDPDSVEILNNFAAALQSQGKVDQAIQQWSRVLELDRANPFAHFNLGVAMAEKGEYDRSVMHLKEALRERPDWVEVHLHLGLVLFKGGDVDEAITHFTEVLQIMPNDVEAHCNLGIALGSVGRLDEAIEHFQQAIRFEPGSVLAHYNLGYALELQGEFAEATAEYRQVLQIDPTHTASRIRLEEALAKQKQNHPW